MCEKCKGDRNFYGIPPYIEGLERNLCQICYWENEASLNGELNSIHDKIRDRIVYFIENAATIPHADAVREELERIYYLIEGTIMFDGNNAIKYNSERLGYAYLNEIADRVGCYYTIQQPITVPDRYGIDHTYYADAYIEYDEYKLVIEFDGGVHNIESNRNGDHRRDCDLKDAGYSVLRFNIEDHLEQFGIEYTRNWVMNTIEFKLWEWKHPGVMSW